MKTFPMFLKMAGRRVVIAGGGEQAAQKCRLMLKTEAAITVLAPELEEELRSLADDGRITWQQGPITPDVFRDTALVFVATGCPGRSEEHTSELQSHSDLVCRLLLEKKKKKQYKLKPLNEQLK